MTAWIAERPSRRSAGCDKGSDGDRPPSAAWSGHHPVPYSHNAKAPKRTPAIFASGFSKSAAAANSAKAPSARRTRRSNEPRFLCMCIGRGSLDDVHGRALGEPLDVLDGGLKDAFHR